MYLLHLNSLAFSHSNSSYPRPTIYTPDTLKKLSFGNASVESVFVESLSHMIRQAAEFSTTSREPREFILSHLQYNRE